MATITNSLSTSGIQTVLQSGTGAINIGTAAAANTITIGNATGATAVNINTGTAGSAITTKNGPLTLNTGTGNFNICNDNTSNNIFFGVGSSGNVKNIQIGGGTGSSFIGITAGSAGFQTVSSASSTFIIATTPGTVQITSPTATKFSSSI